MDGKVILSYDDDKIVYRSCEHLHWHEQVYPEEPATNLENIKEDDELDWDDFLKLKYIATITVDGKKLYLVWYLARPTEGGFTVLNGQLPSDKIPWIFFLPPDGSLGMSSEE